MEPFATIPRSKLKASVRFAILMTNKMHLRTGAPIQAHITLQVSTYEGWFKHLQHVWSSGEVVDVGPWQVLLSRMLFPETVEEVWG